MFPYQIISIASELYSEPGPFQRVFRKIETKKFKQFVQDCLNFGVDIRSIFPITHSFKEILFCMKNNSGPIKCPVCNTTISNAHKNQKWCSIICRSKDKEYGAKISKVKTALYKDPVWKAETEAKRCKTTREIYGVDYPMQNVDIFNKQQKACFDQDENGLYGFEPHAYELLRVVYPTIMNGHTYLKENNLEIKWLGDDGKWHHSYPDFFCPEINTFIEVKSSYTRQIHDYKLMKCIEELKNMKIGYMICVAYPRKGLKFEIFNLDYIDD